MSAPTGDSPWSHANNKAIMCWNSQAQGWSVEEMSPPQPKCPHADSWPFNGPFNCSCPFVPKHHCKLMLRWHVFSTIFSVQTCFFFSLLWSVHVICEVPPRSTGPWAWWEPNRTSWIQTFDCNVVTGRIQTHTTCPTSPAHYGVAIVRPFAHCFKCLPLKCYGWWGGGLEEAVSPRRCQVSDIDWSPWWMWLAAAQRISPLLGVPASRGESFHFQSPSAAVGELWNGPSPHGEGAKVFPIGMFSTAHGEEEK